MLGTGETTLMKGQNPRACWGQAAMEQHSVVEIYLEYIPKTCSKITSQPMCSSHTLWVWCSCHWEVRSVIVPLMVAPWKWHWLPRLCHKRLYSFCLVLLGYSSLQSQASMQEVWGYLDGQVDRPWIDVMFWPEANLYEHCLLNSWVKRPPNASCPWYEVTPSLPTVLAEVPDAMEQTVPALTFLNSWPTQSINIIK